MTEAWFVFACMSTGLSLVTLALLVPLYGKVFFSKHAVEYRPIEEIAAIRKGLTGEQDPGEQADDRAGELSGQLFGMHDETFDVLQRFRTIPLAMNDREKKERHTDAEE